MTKAKAPKAPEKKEISVKIEEAYFDLDYASLDDAIESLTKLKSFEGQYTELRFESVNDCGCYYACDCSKRLRLFGKRLENDAEFAKRVEQETKRAADQAERDRRDFERLSKQFGKS